MINLIFYILRYYSKILRIWSLGYYVEYLHVDQLRLQMIQFSVGSIKLVSA